MIDEESGLGGRLLITLAKAGRATLPWNRFRVGAPVLLTPSGKKSTDGLRGVVFEQQPTAVGVALAGVPEDWGAEVWVQRNPGGSIYPATMSRPGECAHALVRAAAARGDRLADLRAVLLGEREPEFVDPPPDRTPDGDPPLNAGVDSGPNANLTASLNASLNLVQRQAVRFALSAADFALLHGPPGTGKTTTVVELIRCAVARGEKVLACAPSNLGVDNLFERLLAAGENAVRLGHPARVMPQLRARALDMLVDDHADARLARKLVKQALGLFRKASRWSRARPAPGERREIRHEAKSLLADARRLETQAVEQILNAADVICATTTGLNSDLLGGRRFDLAVIDEACQSTEPGCWLPLLWSDRVVLAGDHCQLPATVVDVEAERAGFGVSLFERLLARFGPGVCRRLTVQYRMHEAIMEFPSAEFYDAELTADDSVRGHLLSDLDGVQPSPLTESPLEFIDTAGANFDEQPEPDGESRCNPREAELVCRKVQQLIESGLPPQAIAVIAPYAAQVRLLREAASAGGAGNRQRRRLPGTREGSGGDLAGAFEPPRRDRLSPGNSPHQRRLDAGPAKAAGDRRQRDPGPASVLCRDARILRKPIRLPLRLGGARCGIVAVSTAPVRRGRLAAW